MPNQEKASGFSMETFNKAVNKVTNGNGLEQIANRARNAISEEIACEITPYAMLALTTSFQSLLQECENRGIPKKDILYAISIDGIKDNIADQKAEKEASRAKTRAKR